MISTAVWWVLGLLGVGAGVAYVVYSRSAGKNVPIAHACVADLPAARLADVNAAIAAKDSTLLRSYATQADTAGWACAAREMRASASKIDQGRILHATLNPTGTTASIASSLEFAPGKGPTPVYVDCDAAILGLPTDARFAADGESRPTLRELAQAAIATNTQSALNNAADVLDLSMYKGVYSAASGCLRDLALAAPPPESPIADLTLDELPVEWSDTLVTFSFLPHNVEGWKSGGAKIYQALRDAGYLNAARQVIYTFLPEGPDPSTPGSTWATGG